MAAVIETGLPDLIYEVGSELDDLDIDESDRGRLNNNRVTRHINSSTREVFRRLRLDRVDIASLDPYTHTLSTQPSDSDRYLLPRRARQVFWLKDDDYYLLSLDPHETSSSGFVYRRGTLELRNYTVNGTITAALMMEPVELSYGVSATGTGSTAVVLATSPDLGRTHLEPDYYVGSYIGFETGAAIGEVRRVTAQSISSGVVTLTVTAFTSAPSAADKYTFLLDLPKIMDRPVIYRSCEKLARFDKVLSTEQADIGPSIMAREYERAYMASKVALRNAVYGHTRVTPKGYSSFGRM
jgi:hypothetical protein